MKKKLKKTLSLFLALMLTAGLVSNATITTSAEDSSDTDTIEIVAGDDDDEIVVDDDETDTVTVDDSNGPAAVEEPDDETVTEEPEVNDAADVVYNGSDNGIKVEATASSDALPEEAQLYVEKFESGSEEFKDAALAVGLDEDASNMVALDISFMVNGEEVEPTDTVDVSIDLTKIVPSDADLGTVKVTHLEENGDEVSPKVVASGSDVETESGKTMVEFEVDSFSSFTITWGSVDSPSTSVTVYVYDINGLGIHDEDEMGTYAIESTGTLTIEQLLTDHVTGKIDDKYNYVYATVQYLTTSDQGGTVTTIGSADDPVISVSWNGTNYVVTTLSNNTDTVTKTDTVAAEFYINLYFSTPTVAITVTGADSTNHTVSLTAASSYFTDTDITYSWEIISGDEYASITGSGANATVTWNEGDEAGTDITVKVTATSANGETATATYDLEYGMQQITYTVYYDNTILASGAHVALKDTSGNTVSNGTTDENGQVTLWVVPNTIYSLDASYTASSGTGIAMTYIHYIYENESYVYLGDGTDDTTINLETSDANFYEHVDVKLAVADQDSEDYTDVLANIDYVKIYDEFDDLLYQSIQLVHNSGTTDYNVLFGDENGNSRGDNDHSIAFYDTYTIEIAYEVSYTYEDSEGNTKENTETYIAYIDSDSKYDEDEYYSYSGVNSYQLYNEIYDTEYTADTFAAAVAAGEGEGGLAYYNEHGIDIGGMYYFTVAAALCDTKDLTGQAGLDIAIAVGSLRRYSSNVWNFDIQKTLKNFGADEGDFKFNLYYATYDENTDQWLINVSDTLDSSTKFITVSNEEMTMPDGYKESTTTISDGYYSVSVDSLEENVPSYYYLVLLEETGNNSAITYDPTVYGIKLTVILDSSGDINIEATYYNLTENASGEDSDVEVEDNGDRLFTVSSVLESGTIENEDLYPVFSFENVYVEETEITVEKVWEDEDDQDGKRPNEITVHLYDGETEIDSAVIMPDDDGNWTYTFENLPKYRTDEDGYYIKNTESEGYVEIEYTVKEDPVEGYETTITTDAEGDYDYVITNSYDPETTAITVNKEWADADNQDGIRPGSVTVQLMADEVAIGNLETLSDTNGWTFTWEDLPVYSGGKEITYTVIETDVDGYEAEIGELTPITGDEGIIVGYTITVKNTHTPATVDIPVTKNWEDMNNSDNTRPEYITYQLYANYDGSVDDERNLVYTPVLGENGENVTATVTAKEDWSYVFEGLPKCINGQEIAYTVVEEAEGYITDVTNAIDDETGEGNKNSFVVTNRIEATVEKYVADENYEEEFNKADEADNEDTMEYEILLEHVGGCTDVVLHDHMDEQLLANTLSIKSVVLYSGHEDDNEGKELTLVNALPDVLDDPYVYMLTTGECTDPDNCAAMGGCTFEISINDDALKDYDEYAYIVIILDVELSESTDDFVDDVDVIPNDVELSYSYNYTPQSVVYDEVTTYSYGFDIFKYDSVTSEGLAGAKFIVSRTSDNRYAAFEASEDENGNISYLLAGWADELDDLEVEKNNYTTTLVSDINGHITIEGLHDGTFTVEETEAPEGYDLDNEVVTVTIEVIDDDYEHPTINATNAVVDGYTVSIGNNPTPTTVPDGDNESDDEDLPDASDGGNGGEGSNGEEPEDYDEGYDEYGNPIVDVNLEDDENGTSGTGNAEEDVEGTNAKTSDNSLTAMYLGFAVLSLIGIAALYGRKRRYSK